MVKGDLIWAFIAGCIFGYATLYFRLLNICITGETHHREKILGKWYTIYKEVSDGKR